MESTADCITCDENKNTSLPFAKSSPGANKILGHVVSDVCSPLPDSIGNFKYYLTFIGEYTRLCKLFLIKSRNEVPMCFKVYVEWAERQTGEKLKSFLSDNAREYKCAEVIDYCREKGIEITEIVPYTP